MRANIPTDDSALLPVEDAQTAAEKVTKEMRDLANIGSSPSWKIIETYLDQRIDTYKKGLFGEDLSGQDAAVIGQRFLAAQSVIQEFETLKNEVNTVTKAVQDVNTSEEPA
jgi:hypothetical protein